MQLHDDLVFFEVFPWGVAESWVKLGVMRSLSKRSNAVTRSVGFWERVMARSKDGGKHAWLQERLDRMKGLSRPMASPRLEPTLRALWTAMHPALRKECDLAAIFQMKEIRTVAPTKGKCYGTVIERSAVWEGKVKRAGYSGVAIDKTHPYIGWILECSPNRTARIMRMEVCVPARSELIVTYSNGVEIEGTYMKYRGKRVFAQAVCRYKELRMQVSMRQFKVFGKQGDSFPMEACREYFSINERLNGILLALMAKYL